MAGAISPVLARVTGSHFRCKEQVEKDLTVLSQAWEKLFTLIKVEFIKITDVRAGAHNLSSVAEEFMGARTDSILRGYHPEAKEKGNSVHCNSVDVSAKTS